MAKLSGPALLVAMWVALWGEATAANVAGGVLAAAVITALFVRRGSAGGRQGPHPAAGSAGSRTTPGRPMTPPRLLAVARFALWFTYKLGQSTAVVALEVIRPQPHIAPGVVAVTLTGVTDGLATTIANAISLTPGTLTLEVARRGEDVVLYVHCLHLFDVPKVRAELETLGRQAIAAFGHPSQRCASPGPQPRAAETATR